MARVQSLKDPDAYKSLIKLHLDQDPRHSTERWNSSDLDVVVGHYEKFLIGVANTGCKINEKVLTKSLTHSFANSAKECNSFAKKMHSALGFCRNKCREGQCSTGAKTSAAVWRVMEAIKASKGCLEDGADVPDTASPVDLVEPATPPKQGACGDDAMAALMKLQRAFGEEPVSDAACSSITLLDPPSPVSVCSSSCAASPEGKMSTAASSSLGAAAETTVARKVPGFSGAAP